MDDLLDVKGLLCPLPVLKARKILSGLEPGTLLTVEATDPASVIDFPHFCTETGHSIVDIIMIGAAANAARYRTRSAHG